MDALFNGPNLICHSAGCILNASAISRSGGKFCLFTDGLSEGVSERYGRALGGKGPCL